MVSGLSIGIAMPTEYSSQDGAFVVTIRQEVASSLLGQAAHAYPNETGGVLVGHYDDSHHVATVEKLTPKAPDSVAGRSAFLRGAKSIGRFLRRLWDTTNPKLHYLGEWHTHPDGSEVASPTDRCTMRSITDDERALCPEPILLILGGDFKRRLSVGAYVYPRGKTEVRLRPTAAWPSEETS
jgi:integrative and conjugative element protein (TIGR02256 family)